MENKTIKISKENYIWLLKLASDMQKKYGKPATFDSAINSLKKCKNEEKKLSKLAGSWKMTDKETENLKDNLKKGWKEWEIQSV
jgi:hypothetical protein